MMVQMMAHHDGSHCSHLLWLFKCKSINYGVHQRKTHAKIKSRSKIITLAKRQFGPGDVPKFSALLYKKNQMNHMLDYRLRKILVL